MSLWRLPAAADDRHTFFAHALALSAAHGPGPWPGDGYPLPDEEAHSLVSASALDSVKTNEQAAEMIGAMVRKPPEAQALQRLHDLLAEYSAVDFANHLTGRIKDLDRERVRNLGRWLAENGTRHSAVAAGIMLIGLTGDERDRELLLLLGSLDALTFYAMEALTRTQSDRDMAVFELAQRVWADGRVLTVSRLKETTDPRIKAWLLREGFRARYNVEYVAYIAATTGDLAGALAEADVDDALLDGASGILRALCNGMPGYEISDYADAPVAIERYLKLVRHKPSIPLINVVLTLDRCLDNDWCQEILSDPDWIAVVQQAIEGPDLAKFAGGQLSGQETRAAPARPRESLAGEVSVRPTPLVLSRGRRRRRRTGRTSPATGRTPDQSGQRQRGRCGAPGEGGVRERRAKSGEASGARLAVVAYGVGQPRVRG
jgi:hypothetical protein